MKKLFLLTLSLLCTVGAPAQERGAFDDFAATLAASDVRFQYAFEVRGDVPMTGSGTAALRGAAYHVSGNGMEFWCDGVTRWIVDRTAKEAYIESVDPSAADYISNPAALLGALHRAFRVETVSDVTLGGRKLRCFRLAPSVEETGLDAVAVYLDGSVPVRVLITVEDGTETLFRLSDYRVKEKSDAAFSFDIASLGSDYVVTDLR